MKAYVINKFGGPEIFQLIDMKIPEIQDYEVLIEVKATSVNPVDLKLRRGEMPYFVHPFPSILHFDVSGIVVDIGQAVTNIRVGDEVYGIAGGMKTRQGALAQYVAAPAELIHKKPRNLSFAESAGVPLAFLTAWEAIILSVNINLSDKVLVHAGVGGVGHFALQLAKLRGANVYATVSSDEKATIAKSLGADVTINYINESIEDYVNKHTGNLGFDIVFDTVGGENLEGCFKSSRLRGHVITILARECHDLLLAATKGLNLHMINVTHPLATNQWQNLHQKALQVATQLLESGKLKIVLDKHIFRMSDICEAHKFLENGNNVGKVCVAW